MRSALSARFHDHRRARDDESADNRQLSGIGISTPDGKAATDHADGAEDELNEHNDAQRFARAAGEIASRLRENRDEVDRKKFGFHVARFLTRHAAHAAPARERPRAARAGRVEWDERILHFTRPA